MVTYKTLEGKTLDEQLELILNERARICADPIYFITTYFKVKDPELGIEVPFDLYTYQQQSLENFLEFTLNLTMKSRQLGLTTIAQAFAAWWMITKGNQVVNVLANRLKVSVKFLVGVRGFIDQVRKTTGKKTKEGTKIIYKSWLVPQYKSDNNAKIEFALENNSVIKAESNNPEAGRGDTINLLIIDEVAAIDFQKKGAMEEIWGSAKLTLTRSKGTCIAISCVTDDTFVFTNKGIQQIKHFTNPLIDCNTKQNEFNKNYQVLGKNKLRAGNIFHYNGVSEILEAKTTFNNIKGSPEHKLWAYSQKYKKLDWFKLKDLCKGDLVNLIYNTQCWGNNDEIDFIPNTTFNHKNIYAPKKITPEFCYLMGLYLGDGTAYDVVRKRQLVGSTFTISNNQDISQAFRDIGLEVKPPKTDINWTVGSTSLVEFMKYIGFDITKKAHDKVIPDRLLQCSKENLVSLLKGLFDSDGCSTNKGSVGYSSSSKQLIDQVRIILQNLGILSHLFTATKEDLNKKIPENWYEFKHDAYKLEIYSTEAQKFYQRIGFKIKYKQDNKNLLLKSSLKQKQSTLPNYRFVVNSLIKEAKITKALLRKNKIYIDVTAKGSKNKAETLYNFLINYKPELETSEVFKYIKDQYLTIDSVWLPIKEINNLEPQPVYDFSLPHTEDKWCHSVLYNGILGHQTPRGKSGWYFDQYTRADEIGWNIINASWQEHPIFNKGMYKWVADETLPEKGYLHFYNDKWPNTFTQEDKTKYKTKDTYPYIKDGKQRSPWYDAESKELGAQKTACELDCSFSGSGGEVVPLETIDSIKKLVKTISPVINKQGFWKYYRVFRKYNKNHEYLIVSDMATGDGSDFHGFVVIDLTTMEVVATFKAQEMDPTKVAEILYQVGADYGKCTISIENNGPGLTALLYLQNTLSYPYNKIFRSTLKKKDPNEKDGKKRKLGFWQSNETRENGGSTLERYLNNNILKIYDQRIVAELETWVWRDGRRDHLPGKNDDLIMALTMAAYIIEYVFQKNARKVEEQTRNLKNKQLFLRTLAVETIDEDEQFFRSKN